MSTKNLQEVLHSSNLVMKPFMRWCAYGLIGYIGYTFLTPKKTVERIPPNYVERRRQMGLPDIPIKHPAWAVKEMRIVPEDEIKYRTRN